MDQYEFSKFLKKEAQIMQGEISQVVNEDEAYQNLLSCVSIPKDRVHFSPIYQVPSRLREVNPGLFIPRVVSIGPLHKGDPNTKSVENKKPASLTRLLEEVGSVQETLAECVQKVRNSIETIKGFYFGMKDECLRDNGKLLVEMMVMDACYILQFIKDLSTPESKVSKNRLRSRNIALDLVLIENQILFFVLQDVYDVTIKKLKGNPTLTTMLTRLLELVNPFEQPLKEEDIDQNPNRYHILGLLHEFYKPPIGFNLPTISDIPTVHSITELDKVGVQIRANKKLTWPMAIEFENSLLSRKSTVKMPVVHIDTFFEVVLRNLIAYEQYSPVDNYITSYAMAMDMLVATATDIAMLGKSKVIISHLGSDENVSNMISNVCENVNLQDFYYVETWKSIVEKIDQYYNIYWSRNFEVLKQTYLDTPWKAIALVGGIILFLLAIVQFSIHIKH